MITSCRTGLPWNRAGSNSSVASLSITALWNGSPGDAMMRTLFISASKSGSTLETRSHTDYFFEKGGVWAAITDPGSDLEQLAARFQAAFV